MLTRLRNCRPHPFTANERIILSRERAERWFGLDPREPNITSILISFACNSFFMAAEDGGEGPKRHDHELLEVNDLDPYTCTGCKEKGVNIGCQCSTPSCNVCIFHLECATLADEKQHPIQGHLTFRFRKKTLLPHRCTACDHELKGFVYETENHDMRLHPLCLMLPSEFEYEGQSYTLWMREGDPYRCYACDNMNQHGWKYTSGDHCMDVRCAKYYQNGLSARGIRSSPVHRKRDKLAQSLPVAAALTAASATVGTCFHAYQSG